MIESFFDTDFYKLTAAQVAYNRFYGLTATYAFVNRGNTPFPTGFAEDLKAAVNDFPSPTEEGVNSLTGFDPRFTDWLKTYKFDPRELSISQTGGDLNIRATGPWHRVLFWEVPLMATVSELYFRDKPVDKHWLETVSHKARQVTRLYEDFGVKVGDFGTRRRFSSNVHKTVVERMSSSPGFLGTSNVYLSQLYKIPVLGTYGHECPMAMQAKYGFFESDKVWMDAWLREWQGDHGIAVPDTLTSGHFLTAHFNGYYARVFDGVKQDSGDPVEFTRKLIAHYEKLGIDPKSKKVMYTDSLNLTRVRQLAETFHGKIQMAAGIGTNFTNDVGHKPLNIVVKMVEAGTKPVVKLSDDPGKHTGDKEAVERAKQEIS